MKTMSRAECIAYCENRLFDLWQNHGRLATHSKRHERYIECKDFCKRNGYNAIEFYDMWKKALKFAESSFKR